MKKANHRDLLKGIGTRGWRRSLQRRAGTSVGCDRGGRLGGGNEQTGFGAVGLEGMEQRVLMAAFTYAELADRFDLPTVLHDLERPSGAEYQGFGHAATALGDVNDDGFADFAISAPGSEFGAETPVAGAVFIFSGQDGTILHTLTDGSAGFGFALANLGDVNGDGINDLLIGSPQFDHDDNGTAEQFGRAWVFSGANGSEIRHLDGIGASDEFGFAVATIGDLNDDDINEFAIGIPGGGAGAGQVLIFSGSDGTVFFNFVGDAVGHRFGAAVIGPGDLGATLGAAGDGIPDILIAAPGSDDAPDFAGKVYLYDGALLAPRWSVDGVNAGDRFGASLAVSHVSSTRAIIHVGTPGFDAPSGEDTLADAGRVYHFNQDASPVVDIASWDGSVAGGNFGAAVRIIGDIDGNGSGDVAVIAPGAPEGQRVHVFSGAGNVGGPMMFTADTIALLGDSIFALGDIDNDGFADIGAAFASGDRFSAVSSLAVSPPSIIEFASDNLSYMFTNQTGGRAFAIIEGRLVAFNMVPGLLDSDHVLGVNNAGDIVVRSDVEGAAGLYVIRRNGPRELLQDTLVGIPNSPAPDFPNFEFVRIGNNGDLLFTDSDNSSDEGTIIRSWLVRDNTIQFLWNGEVRDVNAGGEVLGVRMNGNERVIVLRSADGSSEQTIDLAEAWRVNDNGLVAGVNADGDLATWLDGDVTVIGDLELPAGAVTSDWTVIGLNNDGRVLAAFRTGTAGPSPIFTTTDYLFVPGEGLHNLLDVTYDLDAGEDPRHDRARFMGADGDIVAHLGRFSAVSNDAPWVGLDGTPLWASSGGGALAIAGINQYGDAVLLRRDGAVWRGSRIEVEGLFAFETFTINQVLTHTGAATGWTHVFLLTTQGGFVGVHTTGTPATILARALDGGEGSTQIVDHATAFESHDGRVHIAGVDSNGQLVIYFQTNPQNADQFFYDNLTTTHIESQSGTYYGVSSNLTVLIAQWGATHLFYLNEDGALISVWIAPQMTYWASTNISDSLLGGGLAERPERALSGEITAYGTPWGGLNVAAAGEDGDPTAIWWVPGFEGTWRHDKLDTGDSAPVTFNPDSTVSYTTPWGGLNVATIEEDGDIAVFWWVPGFESWIGQELTIGERPDGLTFAGDISAAIVGEMLNLFARGSDGDLYRIFWNPGDGGVWNLDNMTESLA